MYDTTNCNHHRPDFASFPWRKVNKLKRTSSEIGNIDAEMAVTSGVARTRKCVRLVRTSKPDRATKSSRRMPPHRAGGLLNVSPSPGL